MGDDMQIIVAANNVEAQYVEMAVPLYSYGCDRKIKKALVHLKGIYSVDVDFNKQKVTVWGICNKYDVLSTIRKKRKEARFWNPEDNDNYLQLMMKDAASITGNDDQLSVETETLNKPNSFSKRSTSSQQPLALILARSLSWKSWKKVFVRSYSF